MTTFHVVTGALADERRSELARTGRKRETIRKSVKYLAAVLEENGIEPNPARDKRVRLPHVETVELEPPTSEHVEAVVRLLARAYRRPLLWQEWWAYVDIDTEAQKRMAKK